MGDNRKQKDRKYLGTDELRKKNWSLYRQKLWRQK